MSNLRTPLFDWHVAAKARMVPFGGWDMPVQYTGVIDEHQAVRKATGLFDISHMARLTVRGHDALKFLELIFTNAVSTMKPGQVRYGLVCREDGGILDDILITRFSDHFAVCVNASNREKILGWMHTHSLGMDVKIVDHTMETTMVAVQGPGAVALMQGLLADDVSGMKYYFASPSKYRLTECVVSRTGYTGEDGYELIVPNDLGVKLWEELVSRGAKPCGLGARDTLRLEAAMPLYGHELSETIDPLEADLGWAVKLDKGEFIGRQALLSCKETPAEFRKQRVGIQLEGKRAAREGSGLVVDGQPIGTVTSGSYVPYLERSIGMGYVPVKYAAPGTKLGVDLRGTEVPAVVVPLPFYKRSK